MNVYFLSLHYIFTSAELSLTCLWPLVWPWDSIFSADYSGTNQAMQLILDVVFAVVVKSPTLLFLLVFNIRCYVLVMWRSGEYFVLRKAILGIKSTMYYELSHCLDAFLIFDVEMSCNWSTKFRISEGKSWNFIASQRVQPVTNRRVCVPMFQWSYFPTV